MLFSLPPQNIFLQPSFHAILVPPYPLHLRLSGVFPLTLCAIQIYLLIYLITKLTGCNL